MMAISAFLTDPSICIGCKACEVACKEWNQLPDDGFEWSGQSYDNTRALGASTWRHVLFLEQPQPLGAQITGTPEPFRWQFLSDVCKHCANAGCLEACPTGAIVRTEFGSVFGSMGRSSASSMRFSARLAMASSPFTYSTDRSGAAIAPDACG